jgi:hypothetical protein
MRRCSSPTEPSSFNTVTTTETSIGQDPNRRPAGWKDAQVAESQERCLTPS